MSQLRSDAALAIEVARDLIAEGRDSKTISAALHLASNKLGILAIQTARELVDLGRYDDARIALDVAFEQLGVPAGEINPRLQRVRGKHVRILQVENHLATRRSVN